MSVKKIAIILSVILLVLAIIVVAGFVYGKHWAEEKIAEKVNQKLSTIEWNAEIQSSPLLEDPRCFETITLGNRQSSQLVLHHVCLANDFDELLDAIEVLSDLNVVAFDMNELSPAYDNSGRSTALACKLMREMLLRFAK